MKKFLLEAILMKYMKKMKDKIIQSFEEYLNNGSFWKFYKSLKIILNVNKIQQLLASSYIPTPDFLKNKNAIINPQNDDQKCLLWSIAIKELLKTNPNLRNSCRITKILKKKAESFNVKGMEFPCGFSDIDKFEKNNNIAINVFGHNEEESF